MDSIKRGTFTVDFTCDQTGYQISVFEVAAVDGVRAERLARETLHPQFTWHCTGTDLRRDARD